MADWTSAKTLPKREREDKSWSIDTYAMTTNELIVIAYYDYTFKQWYTSDGNRPVGVTKWKRMR